MVDAPLAVGFTAGMLAAFNPCGFAMLPAYLGFFVGTEGNSVDRAPGGAAQALRVGAAVMAVFVAYAAGMGAVLTGLAVAIALARQSMVRRLRGLLPHVQRASGVLLAAAGAYVAFYGWFELRLAAGANAPAGPVDTVGRLSGRISTWISDIGATRLGLAVVVLVTLAVATERRRRRIPAPAPERDEVDSRR